MNTIGAEGAEGVEIGENIEYIKIKQKIENLILSVIKSSPEISPDELINTLKQSLSFLKKKENNDIQSLTNILNDPQSLKSIIYETILFQHEKISIHEKDVKYLPFYKKLLKEYIKDTSSKNQEFAKEHNPYKNQGIFLNETPNALFTILGSIKVSPFQFTEALNNDENLKKYFSNKDRISWHDKNIMQLTGYNNVISVDEKASIKNIISTTYKEIEDSFQILQKIEANEIVINKENHLFYCAILQNLKDSYILIFNAFISDEKLGDFKNEDETYQEARKQLANTLKYVTKQYYNILVGEPILSSPQNLLTDANDKFIRESIEEFDNPKRFDKAELSNSMIILSSALNTALKNPEIDTIISLPFGGTEYAVAIQLAYEKIYNKKVEIFILPVSLYGTKDLMEKKKDKKDEELKKEDILGSDSTKTYLEKNKDILRGKHLLITDNSSGSGKTLELTAKFLNKVFPKNIKTVIAKVSPYTFLKGISPSIPNPKILESSMTSRSIRYTTTKKKKNTMKKEFTRGLRKRQIYRIIEQYYKRKNSE